MSYNTNFYNFIFIVLLIIIIIKTIFSLNSEFFQETQQILEVDLPPSEVDFTLKES